jgi:hypothetical protein
MSKKKAEMMTKAIAKDSAMTRNPLMMRENPLWIVIRVNSRFCARCGKKLDLPFKDFHLPFCTKCRDEVINNIKRETHGKKKS